MGLLTRKTESNPLGKNIDQLLDEMNHETYEDSLKKIEERIKELGILDSENDE